MQVQYSYNQTMKLFISYPRTIERNFQANLLWCVVQCLQPERKLRLYEETTHGTVHALLYIHVCIERLRYVGQTARIEKSCQLYD